MGGKKKKNGRVKFTLKPKTYKVRFGSLDGYTLKNPEKRSRKVRLKAGKKKKIRVVYSKNIIQGTLTSVEESTSFSFGEDSGEITGSYAFIDSESVYFQGSGLAGGGSDVVHVSKITDISQIIDVSLYDYEEGSVGPVEEGEFVVYHDELTDSYGAIQVNEINMSSQSISNVKSIGVPEGIDITWYFIANKRSDFSDGDWTPPETGASPGGGTYSKTQSVTLACKDNSGGSGCYKTYYTTDGNTPDTSSPVYTSPITISSKTILSFFSVDSYENRESVKTEKYIIERGSRDTNPPASKASPEGGTYSSKQSITLFCKDDSGKCTTYYTTDRSDPTIKSMVYSSSIIIFSTTTLKFFSVDPTGNQESIQIETYTIEEENKDTTPPVSTASPEGRKYSSEQYVKLSCKDDSGQCKTFYTTDGSDPTIKSPIYSSLITISSSTRLKFFSMDASGNRDSIQTEYYYVD